MERRVSVNAQTTSKDRTVSPDGLPMGWSGGPWNEGDTPDGSDEALLLRGEGTSRPSSAGHGPCLYFGSAGQRCKRPALASGFCARHQPRGRGNAIKNPPRVLAAAGAIAALLWPYLDDVVREIIRWAHSR